MQMYTDMRDFEPEYTTEIDGLTVEIEKVGGGALGESYEGKWSYRVTRADEELDSGHDLFSGTHNRRTGSRVVTVQLPTGEAGYNAGFFYCGKGEC